MTKVIIDCEMNSECIKWLEEMVGEELGSKSVKNKFFLLLAGALEDRILQAVGVITDFGCGKFTFDQKFKNKLMTDLKNPKGGNHNAQFSKTFLKVIWHQLLEHSHGDAELSNMPTISDFEREILLSYIKDIYFDTSINRNLNKVKRNNVALPEAINDILSGTLNEQQVNDNGEKTFKTHFYVNVEDRHSTVESYISQGFDNIELSDTTTEYDGTTIFDVVLDKMPFPLDHLRNLKVTPLPSRDFDGTWENLHYDLDLKRKVYSHARLSLEISHMLRETHTKLCKNNLFLLYGPPGTGKTTFCKAICQKLAIRMKDVYQNSYSSIFIELSCSKVFSRWFGESTKNLDSIFRDIELLLQYHQNSNKFVCLLLDEVESLAFSRTDLLSKSESTDSVRVLNSLMSHVDNLKKYSNFILLCTSNLINNIDPAFLDRLDVTFFVGNPSVVASKNILMNLTQEIINSKIIYLDGNESMLNEAIKQLGQYANVC